MLPNVAALRLSEPLRHPPLDASIGVGLQDVPAAILGKILKDTGNAQSLCDATDKL